MVELTSSKSVNFKEGYNKDIYYMTQALELAHTAYSLGEIPIGAVAVYEDNVVGRAYNRRELDENPCAHAEFSALLQAAQHLKRWRLSGVTIYVTLEPCSMCAGLMVNSRIDRCVFGAYDKKAGALGSLYNLACDKRLNHNFEVTAEICADQSQELLKNFFKELREKRKHLTRGQRKQYACQGNKIGVAGKATPR